MYNFVSFGKDLDKKWIPFISLNLKFISFVYVCEMCKVNITKIDVKFVYFSSIPCTHKMKCGI